MDSSDKEADTSRKQTDESLRAERNAADLALDEDLSVSDEIADAIVNRARARADMVLAAAREKADQLADVSVPSVPSHLLAFAQRALDDKILRRERSHADETLRMERSDSERAADFSEERAATDDALSKERAGADDMFANRATFLGVVSHELRNMLAATVGFAELIENGAWQKQTDQLVGYARQIRRSGTRMSRLVGDLVDVASIEAGILAVVPELSDPAKVVAEAVDDLREQASAGGVSLVTEVVPPLSLVMFDPARILQVLINLIGNALKFTPPKGKIVVRVEQSGGEVRFSVADTGEGIPEDKVKELFFRFRQISKRGHRSLGLGLYISQCIVQGHEGRIWAESKLGEGSRFCFTLPIASDSSVATRAEHGST